MCFADWQWQPDISSGIARIGCTEFRRFPGNGNIPAKAEKALAKASEKGIVVVRASRSNSGPVVPADPSYAAAGFIDSGMLNPQKSRVLLRLALGQTGNREEVQFIFSQACTL